MQFYEMECLIDNMWRKYKESWDQTRLMINWCQQSAKPVNMFEKMKFPWEKTSVGDNLPTQEEKEEMMREMKAMEERMNKK